MGGHHVDGHKSSETPSVHPDAVCVDVRQTLEILHTFHLVGHLVVAEVAERDLLKCLAAMLASAVVENEEDIALLGHVGLPTA